MFQNETTYERAMRSGSVEEFHSRYEKAYRGVLEAAGRHYPHVIDGKERNSGREFEDHSPGDTSLVVGRFQKGTKEDVYDAVLAAERAFRAWSRMDLKERLDIFRRVAEIMRQEKFALSAALTLDIGKTRLEAMADVDEAIDFVEYYRWQMEKNEGFAGTMTSPHEDEEVRSVMHPYGVWAVICPFNFPVAITTGMTTGALVTGNTVVLKPSSPAPLPVFMVYDIFRRAGIPDGVLNFVSGSGPEVGEALLRHSRISGVVFTGSKEVGYSIIKSAGRAHPIPVIAEMGGKNPVIVTENARVDDAVMGVVASAYGYAGQKCSACSRVYLHEAIYDEFSRKLVERVKGLKVGDPSDRETNLGPVISAKAVADFERYAKMASKDGEILVGGRRLSEGVLERGYFVEPTIAEGLTDDHYIVKNELFVPFLCMLRFKTLDDAVRRANDVEYGLTAGIFSRSEKDVEYFLDNIEAGVIYANRRRGGSTGAMVGAQAFSGWKGSGSTGKGSGGEHYLLQFMREQSRTVCKR